MLGDPGAVGHPIQIQPPVAQRLAHGFQVPHRDAGGEKARIMGQLRQAHPGVFDGLLRRVLPFDDIVVEFAIHRRRPAGAALVDEQDVPVPPHALECAGEERVKLHGALAGAAGERDERVGLGVEIERRHHRHAQFDFTRDCAGWVERPDDVRAARRHARHSRPGADAAVFEFNRLGPRQRGGEHWQRQQRRDQAEHCHPRVAFFIGAIRSSCRSWLRAGSAAGRRPPAPGCGIRARRNRRRGRIRRGRAVP